MGCRRNLSVSPSNLASARTAQYGRLERKYKLVLFDSIVMKFLMTGLKMMSSVTRALETNLLPVGAVLGYAIIL